MGMAAVFVDAPTASMITSFPINSIFLDEIRLNTTNRLQIHRLAHTGKHYISPRYDAEFELYSLSKYTGVTVGTCFARFHNIEVLPPRTRTISDCRLRQL